MAIKLIFRGVLVLFIGMTVFLCSVITSALVGVWWIGAGIAFIGAGFLTWTVYYFDDMTEAAERKDP